MLFKKFSQRSTMANERDVRGGVISRSIGTVFTLGRQSDEVQYECPIGEYPLDLPFSMRSRASENEDTFLFVSSTGPRQECGGAQPRSEAARHDRVPGRDPHTGQPRSQMADHQHRDRQPAVHGREAPDHAPERELRVADGCDVGRPRAGGGGLGLLVRQGGPAGRPGERGAVGPRGDELDPGQCEPASAAGGDVHVADHANRRRQVHRPTARQWHPAFATLLSEVLAVDLDACTDLDGDV